jgi:hypothetical protein
MFPSQALESGTAAANRESSTDTTTPSFVQQPVRTHDQRASPTRSTAPLRITLIRRDPASGSQWNVGSITPQKADGRMHEVEISLTSPGYTPFAKLDTVNEGGFGRKVAFLSTSAFEGQPMTGRSNSAETVGSFAPSGSGKSRQAYAFISPWQGMCVFSNGLDGKSLRCRQSLPAANPSMPAVVADVAELRFNLPWAALRLKDPNKRPALESTNTSSSQAAADGTSNREQFRRSFQMLKHKARKQLSISDTTGDWQFHKQAASSQLGSLQEEQRLSLDLGREKAGGGFKGHSAKLGKLIIHDEGLKMCDLVVAACMGVWWQHYTSEA